MLAALSLNTQQLEMLLIYGIPLVSIVCLFGWLIAKTLSENALKRRMLDQGMSVEEIRDVLSTRCRR